MIKPYKGHYPYTADGIYDNAPKSTGVYYCGAVSDGKLKPYYIGKSADDDGINGRLMDHLSEDKWNDVTHFGFEECSTEQEALNHEAEEIKRYQPKYNDQEK